MKGQRKKKPNKNKVRICLGKKIQCQLYQLIFSTHKYMLVQQLQICFEPPLNGCFPHSMPHTHTHTYTHSRHQKPHKSATIPILQLVYILFWRASFYASWHASAYWHDFASSKLRKTTINKAFVR